VCEQTSETTVPDELEREDLFYTPWVKAFIRTGHADELETVEILLSIGQQMMKAVPRRAQSPRLDLVLAAMLRPALLAAKAADVNLRHGLYEPALGHVRTLLELDLGLEYILADAADKKHRADRYLALAYKERIKGLAEQLSTPAIRTKLDAERVSWIEGRMREFQKGLDALPEATAQNKANGNWHPHGGVKGLATHLQRLDDYLQLYKPMSGVSVHAADPEAHLVFDATGAPHIKALATTEPRAVTTAVHVVGGYLMTFLSRLRDEWALQGTDVDRLLKAASMRFVGTGDGTIPAELRPEAWATAIRITQEPLAEILEEALQLVLVVVGRASAGLTEAEIRNATLGERGHALLRGLLDQIVEMGNLRLDTTVKLHRYRSPEPG